MSEFQPSTKDRRLGNPFRGLFTNFIGYYMLPRPTEPLPPAFEDLPDRKVLIVRSDEQPATELLRFDTEILQILLDRASDEQEDF